MVAFGKDLTQALGDIVAPGVKAVQGVVKNVDPAKSPGMSLVHALTGGGGGQPSTPAAPFDLGAYVKSLGLDPSLVPSLEAAGKGAALTQPSGMSSTEWKAVQPLLAQALASTAQSSAAKQNPLYNVLASLLGQQQGALPPGFTEFFSQVYPGMQQQMQQTFDKQLQSIPGVNPNITANLEAANQAQFGNAGPTGQSLQNLLSQIGGASKLTSGLSTALGYLPYSSAAQGTPIGTDVLNALLGLGSVTSGAAGTTPFG